MRIFLSHSSKDKPLVREIVSHFPHHIKSWIDENNLLIGDEIDISIQNAIQSDANFVILFLGEESIKSEWVRKELEWALEQEERLKRKIILPVLLDKVIWNKVEPEKFRKRKYLECTDYSKKNVKAFSKILEEHLFALSSRELDSIRDVDRSNEKRNKGTTGKKKNSSVISRPNDADIGFINREDELRSITRTLPAPFMLIVAPTGYGKTHLLKKVESALESEYLCFFASLSRQIRYSIQTFGKELLKILRINSSQISRMTKPDYLGWKIGQEIIQFAVVSKKRKVLLIIDNFETLYSDILDPVLNELLPAIVDRFENIDPPIQIRIILASRCSSTIKSIASKIHLSPLFLTPFDFESVHQTVSLYNSRQQAKSNASYVKDFATFLMKLTGGHPECMIKILNSKDFGIPMNIIKSKDRIYFDELVLPIINKIEIEIPDHLNFIFETLCVLRRFSPGLLRHFIDKGLITWDGDEYLLDEQLRETHLVHNDYGFSKDEITRRLFGIQLSNRDRERLSKLRKEAISFYKEQLSRHDCFRPDIISIEILFLFFQRYLWEKCEKVDSYDEILKEILTKMHEFSDSELIIASFKQSLSEDWEFKFIFNDLFPDDPFNDFVNGIS